MVRQKANNKDKRRRNRVKTIILLIFSLILLIIVTIAWFAMNTGTTATGMDVSVKGVPFELKTTGTIAPNDDLIEALGYADGTEVVDGSTTAESGMIKWLLQSNDYMVSGISPSTSGSLPFTIVPNEIDSTKTITVNYHINVRAFRLTDAKKTEIANAKAQGLPEPTVSVTDLIPLSASVPADKAVLDYIDGHLFFFADAGNTERVRSGETHTVSFTADDEEEVPLHWIWPETIGNLILVRAGIPNVCTGEAMQDLIDDIQNNPKSYLVLEDLDDDMYELVEGQPVINTNVLHADVNEYYPILSMAYDSADQMIGVNVQYIMVELEATGTVN